MSDFDDILNTLSGKRSQFTVDEIEKAQAKAKKSGTSFMDVLQEMTGKKLQSPETLNHDAQQISSIMSQQPELSGSALMEDLNKQLTEMNQNLYKDFGIAEGTDSAAAKHEEVLDVSAALERFEGLEETVEASVFGQSNFLKKLAVAFKRPFVLPPEEKHAQNCFYVTGPEDSGKHLALAKMVDVLAERGILSSKEMRIVDLAIYGAAGKDHVFLQDLYMALKSDAQVILFENFDGCHISYLAYLNDLVIKGECQLQERYQMQKGQLVNVTNSFASEAVSTFNASGKYLVFMSSKDVDALANSLGAPFINALGDICRTESLTEQSYMEIAKVRWAGLIEKADRQFGFKLSGDPEPIFASAVAATEKNAGTSGLIVFFDNLLKSLATLKLEGDFEKDTEVVLRVEDGKLLAEIAGEKIDLMDNLPASYTGALEAVKEEMNNIVGLQEIKDYIFSLEEYYTTQKRRKEAGLKSSDVSKHMIFTGNPGTGKTTIARIVSRYLKAIGVLTGGQLVEVSRADLVGRYVGHTAPLVNQVLKSAIGGVLFIDEAYSLYRGKDDSFGLEAIDTLVKGIEDNRDNLIVILAGYSKEMAEFMEANSGLKSRFPNYIDFPDYTGEELLAITRIMVKSKGYVLDEGTEPALLSYYNVIQATRADTAGNGRLVRNKVEEAILNQSRRLIAEPEADLSLLTSIDFDLSDLAKEE